MKIRRLRVTDFAAIREADVELGPGLNVLHGPNDLGKSTLADAIRLALLLPHSSAHIEDYVPWTGGRNPVIELTFETEPHRIWRVRKEFRKGGAAILEESKNGVDFDEVERGRKVDATLREMLRWGLPELGGAGASRGLPSSFLATALLSTQADVTAVLSEHLGDDPTSTGKDRIAAALQAVAQDPLFLALLKATQARRDEAFTEKGARKAAKGSVFKEAADRLKEVRDEKERLQIIVEDSEGVEKQLRELTAKRSKHEEALALATERVKTLEQHALQGAALLAAAEQVRIARDEVERIQDIDRDVHASEQNVKELAVKVTEAEKALKIAQGRFNDAETTFDTAEKAATADGSDSQTKETVARQALELRRVAAEQAGRETQRRIEAALATQKLVEIAAKAAVEHQKLVAETNDARATCGTTASQEQVAGEQLRRLEFLERALEARAAEREAEAAKAGVEEEAFLRGRFESETRERDELIARRAAIAVPSAASLAPLRRLANELAGARGAVNVGFVVNVALQRPVDLRIRKDGTEPETSKPTTPSEFEANAEVDIEIGDVARVRVRGGRREAQEILRDLEKRWEVEVAPHLAASGVEDLDGLAAKLEDAQALEAAGKVKNAELESLREKLGLLVDATERLSVASERSEACRRALGDVSLDSLAADLAALGSDALATSRTRRQDLTALLEKARVAAAKAVTDFTLAEERSRTAQAALGEAVVARDAELAKFQGGVTIELSAAQVAAAAASQEQKTVAAEMAALESTIAERSARIESAVSNARAEVERTRGERELSEAARTAVLKDHSAEGGRLETLRKQRGLLDLQAAETKLREALDRHNTLPVPETTVTEADVTAARATQASAKANLERIVSVIHKTHGALEQVGGAVARERLRDAIEAFDLAERHERDIEEEYDAWLLLLQQMKEADAAQASNLGQVLAPAIAAKFEALTQKRYENIELTPELGTEGFVVGGAVRPTERLSVGTREQLSTLYRLCLAEYLGTTLVLDGDQLVQSDVERLDWFRRLLAEKARVFQTIVFTCRPNDYLAPNLIGPTVKTVHQDSDDGSIRAINLERAIQRR